MVGSSIDDRTSACKHSQTMKSQKMRVFKEQKSNSWHILVVFMWPNKEKKIAHLESKIVVHFLRTLIFTFAG